MNGTTITITVNVATGNKWEGDAEFKVQVPVDNGETNFKLIDRNRIATELDQAINRALVDYGKSNAEFIDF
jgi:hypothetical protein